MTTYYAPFVIIKMPLNKDGGGPEMDQAKVVKTVYEIWDGTEQTVMVCETRHEAIVMKRYLSERQTWKASELVRKS